MEQEYPIICFQPDVKSLRELVYCYAVTVIQLQTFITRFYPIRVKFDPDVFRVQHCVRTVFVRLFVASFGIIRVVYFMYVRYIIVIGRPA